MEKKYLLAVIMVAVISGVIGGMISCQLAVAKNDDGKVLRVHKIILLNLEGKEVGLLTGGGEDGKWVKEFKQPPRLELKKGSRFTEISPGSAEFEGGKGAKIQMYALNLLSKIEIYNGSVSSLGLVCTLPEDKSKKEFRVNQVGLYAGQTGQAFSFNNLKIARSKLKGSHEDVFKKKNEADKNRFLISHVTDKSFFMGFSDKRDKIRIAMEYDEKRKPSIAIIDSKGQSRAVIGYTETINKKTSATTEHPESTLTLFNKNGDVLWQRP